MNTIVYVLAIIGAGTAFCTLFFLAVGIVSSIRGLKEIRKSNVKKTRKT